MPKRGQIHDNGAHWCSPISDKTENPVSFSVANLKSAGTHFVMVLSCHSNGVDVSSLLLDCAFGGFSLHLPIRS